jgi:HD-GYP domain-containing protein (c-di-GMP phosphodiesterase class II)
MQNLPHPLLPPSGAQLNVQTARLSEILSALSHALDLTEGQPLGHTMRSCLIGMRIGEELGLDDEQRDALYYALLLKDAGCSSNASHMASAFGTADQGAKYRMKLTDWHARGRLAIRTALTAGRGGSLVTRVRHLAGLMRAPDLTRDLIRIRCDRGADIARQLGFPEQTAAAIRSLDEHWCGLGYPDRLAGTEIPLLARIALLSQTVEIFHAREGVDSALQIIRRRAGTWFDPALVRIVLGWWRDTLWWQKVATRDVAAAVQQAEPAGASRVASLATIHRVARAFAEIIDAKSPFTYRHSSRVAQIAAGIAQSLGMAPALTDRLVLAGLLHDIGKLGVSSRVLEKPGALSKREWRHMREHPVHTYSILSRVSAFGDFARTAAVHHEKLDGSGYPWRLTGDELDMPARVLAVADMYEALTAARPYRDGLEPQDAILILEKDRGTKLDAACLDALDAWLAASTSGSGRPQALYA